MTYSAIDTAHDDDARDGLRGGAWPVEWQDIASAPERGTVVIVWARVDDGDDDEEPEYERSAFTARCSKAQGLWWVDQASMILLRDVTHWRPALLPPVGAA